VQPALFLAKKIGTADANRSLVSGADAGEMEMDRALPAARGRAVLIRVRIHAAIDRGGPVQCGSRSGSVNGRCQSGASLATGACIVVSFSRGGFSEASGPHRTAPSDCTKHPRTIAMASRGIPPAPGRAGLCHRLVSSHSSCWPQLIGALSGRDAQGENWTPRIAAGLSSASIPRLRAEGGKAKTKSGPCPG